MSKVESYNIDMSQGAACMSTITDISFPDIFASLNTGRDSSDRVLQTIIEGLLEGRYQPGERVVARQLAEQLGVSIVPVREAIHILAGEGVIDLTARYAVSEQVTFFAGVQNLTDREYLVSRHPHGPRPGAPRFLYGGFELEF